MSFIIIEEKEMRKIQQQFQVNYQYPVYFTRQLFQQENETFSNFIKANIPSEEDKKFLFVLDEGMLMRHPHLKEEIAAYFRYYSIYTLLPFIIFPGGEEIKNNSRYLEKILAAVNEYKIDRHSFIVAVGGGALLDLVGYAAAIAHRGIRHIRIPTTVLSQNDSGVGVKNGINYFGKKNFVGTFSPPFAVFNDHYFLDTLDDRNWRNGMAEAVKVALIKDVAFFEWLDAHAEKLAHRDSGAMEQLVYRCAELHLQHIASGDPFESGSSRPLDFGHWSAHKLEQLSGFSLTHGEAVSIGIALDAVYSVQIGWLTSEEEYRILNVLQKMGFELYHPLLKEEDLLKGLSEFREHLGGRLTIMMLKNIGTGKNIHSIDMEIMHKSIGILKDHKTILTN